MSGFENLPHNGLEQLLINMSAERIQYLINDLLLTQEYQQYKDAGVNVSTNGYKNNETLIGLFMVRYKDR